MVLEREQGTLSEFRLVGFTGGGYLTPDEISKHDPIFEVEKDPGFVYGMGWKFDPREAELSNMVSRGIVRTRKEELERNGGANFADFVEDFASRNITVRADQKLAFLGPQYRENLLKLGLELPSETFQIKDEYGVIVINIPEYETLASRYMDEGIRLLGEEIGNTALGERTERMDTADKVLRGTVYGGSMKKEVWLSFIVYAIQTLNLRLALISTIIHARHSGIANTDFLTEAVSYFEQLKVDKPLTQEERQRLEAFLEEAKKELQSLVDKKSARDVQQ